LLDFVITKSRSFGAFDYRTAASSGSFAIVEEEVEEDPWKIIAI
jgi:hypothetical protein